MTSVKLNQVSESDHPIPLVAFYNKHGLLNINCNPDLHGLLRLACEGVLILLREEVRVVEKEDLEAARGSGIAHLLVSPSGDNIQVDNKRTIAMLAVEALLLVSPVSAYLGWYNICICLPALWSVIRSADTTECSLIPEKESASNGGGTKTAEPATSAADVGDEKVRATKRHHDNENKRQAVVDNAAKGDNSNNSQISTGDNNNAPFSNVTSTIDGNVEASITAGYVGRDIKYEKTIRDNVVSGPSNIGDSVQQATMKGLSAGGNTPETEVDDPGENKHDLSNRNVITSNTVKQDDTTVTDSSLENTQMKNVFISGNPDLSRIDGRSGEATETDEDCDAHPGNGTSQIIQNNIRVSRRDSNMREAIEIQTLLKDIKGEASEASSVVATTMERMATTSRQAKNDLRSKVTELTAEVEKLKNAKREAEEACSSFATLTKVVESKIRQVDDNMNQLRSKVADLTTVVDTLQKTTREVREAAVTVATTKQEVASPSRQAVDQMDTFYSKVAELTTALNELKGRRCCNSGYAHWHCH